MGVDRVLIAGAGPVGLVTGLSLARQGVPVTILEAGIDLAMHSRAATFHSPTLEIFEELGFIDPLLKMGLCVRVMRMADAGLGETVELPFEILEKRGITRYPYDFCLSQGEVAKAALAVCRDEPNIDVLFDHEVTDIDQNADEVVVHCDTAHRRKEFKAPWLIGADGAASVVRKCADIKFDGFTWTDRFLIVEIHVDMTDIYGPVTFMANGPDWRLVLMIPEGPGKDDWSTRVLSSIPETMADKKATAAARLEKILQSLRPSDKPYSVSSTTIYSVHQRVAETFRKGRTLLVGDAAHINSPLGAMGLNSGIHDGVNLAEKLTCVAKGKADHRLLNLYNRQRRSTTIDFIQKKSIENKKRQEETDLEKRRQAMAMFHSFTHDEEALLAFSKGWQMYDSLEYAASIR